MTLRSAQAAERATRALSALAVSAAGLARAGAGVGAAGGRIAVGVWIDIGSIPRDSGGIRKMVDDLADMGVLDVYAEVFNRGLTIYPSAVAADYGLPAQRDAFRDAFAGEDP